MYIHILIYYIYIYIYYIYIVYTYSYSHILCTYSKYSYAWCPYRSMKIHINTLCSTETNACVAKISNCFSAVQEYLGLRSSCGKDRQSRRVLHQPTGRPSGFKASNCHSRNSLTFSVMNDCFVVCICDFVGFLQLCFQNTFGCHSDCWSSGNVQDRFEDKPRQEILAGFASPWFPLTAEGLNNLCRTVGRAASMAQRLLLQFSSKSCHQNRFVENGPVNASPLIMSRGWKDLL